MGARTGIHRLDRFLSVPSARLHAWNRRGGGGRSAVRWLLLVMLLVTLAWPVAAQENPAPDDEPTAVTDELFADEPTSDEPSISGAAVTPEVTPTGEPT